MTDRKICFSVTRALTIPAFKFFCPSFFCHDLSLNHRDRQLIVRELRLEFLQRSVRRAFGHLPARVKLRAVAGTRVRRVAEVCDRAVLMRADRSERNERVLRRARHEQRGAGSLHERGTAHACERRTCINGEHNRVVRDRGRNFGESIAAGTCGIVRTAALQEGAQSCSEHGKRRGLSDLLAKFAARGKRAVMHARTPKEKVRESVKPELER